MKLIKYSSFEDFYKDSFDFLMKHEAINSLMIGLIEDIQKNNSIYKNPLMIIAKEKDQIKGVVFQTPPHNLIFSCEYPESFFRDTVEYLLVHEIDFPGILGTNNQIEKFAQEYHKLTGERFVVSMKQRIYQLDKVILPLSESCNLRPATMDEVRLISNWIIGFYKDALPDEPIANEEHSMRLATNRIENNKIYVLENQGKIVTMCAHTRETPNGVSINLVYTPSLYRKKGYATQAVAKLSTLLLEQGKKFCFLYTDLSNPTSNSIYQKIGYKPVTDSLLMTKPK